MPRPTTKESSLRTKPPRRESNPHHQPLAKVRLQFAASSQRQQFGLRNKVIEALKPALSKLADRLFIAEISHCGSLAGLTFDLSGVPKARPLEGRVRRHSSAWP